MRIPSGNIPIQPLKHLWERHNEIARRLVAGERPSDIASKMQMSKSRLSVIMASPSFKLRLSELSTKADEQAADIQGRMSKLAIDSMSILESAIKEKTEGISPALKVKVAQDVLDRAGYGAIQKSQNLTAVLTADDLEQLKRRRRQASGVLEAVSVGG